MAELIVNVEVLDPLGDIVGFQTMVVEIMDHPEITNWAVVDDMNMTSDYHFKYDEWRASWGIENFVHTPISNEGIKQSGIKDKIIKILNNDLTIS